MSDNSQEIGEYKSHGAVTRLFGVIFIILGALNTMLSWRGGFEVLSLPIIFLVCGLVLCFIGSVLRHIRS
ncbi:MAG: hypothetical protein GY761_01420 [Hyphomicrobiales bacterium]|nr:hypothetical protein [Hyphomicrobiales bacterium]